MSTPGYVYVMVSSSRDRLVKIGGTKNHPNDRARDLNTTGVPFDWVVSYYEEVSDWELVEKLLHAHFEPQRSNPNREFFSIEPREAIDRLQKFAVLYRPIVQSSIEQVETSTLSAKKDVFSHTAESSSGTVDGPSSETEHLLGTAELPHIKAEHSSEEKHLFDFHAAVEAARSRREADKSLWLQVDCSFCTCRYSVKSGGLENACCPVCQRKTRV